METIDHDYRNMRRGFRLRLLLTLIIAGVALSLSAQRRVTPVNPAAPGTSPKVEREKRVDRSRLVEMQDVNGNTILVDTVTGSEFKDSQDGISAASLRHSGGEPMEPTHARLRTALRARRCLG